MSDTKTTEMTHRGRGRPRKDAPPIAADTQSTPAKGVRKAATAATGAVKMATPRQMTQKEQARVAATTQVSKLAKFVHANSGGKSGDISIRALALLCTIPFNGSIKVKDAADTCGYSKPAITRHADSLCNIGLLARSKNPQDRRDCLLSLTQAGKTFLDNMAKVF